MASFGRSFKPTSYLSSVTTRRPPLGSRSLSNSSDRSSGPSTPTSEEYSNFTHHGRSSTSHPNSQHLLSPHSHTVTQLTGARSPSYRPTNSHDSPLLGPEPARPTPTNSRPIAIELPSSSTDSNTPPPPLSGRGDVPGGYFPLHEEHSRVYRPHPFQLDASKARTRSIQLAKRNSTDTAFLATTTAPDTTTCSVTANPPIAAPAPTTAPAAMADYPHQLKIPAGGNWQSPSGQNTPVSSYNPGGFDMKPLPMGKYYPSNYEKRKEDKRQQELYRAHTSGPAFQDASMRPNSPKSPKSPRESSTTAGYQRDESDIKRRLQQYQRDMIAQATMGMSDGGALDPAAVQSLKNLGFTSIPKPNKPRLEPLGSPGPVTPMELGGSEHGGGYLDAHGPDDNVYAEAMARMLREEEERRRREGASSPAIDMGPSTC